MPANDNEDDHLVHHDIFNPNPNSNHNPLIPTPTIAAVHPAVLRRPKPSPKFLPLLLRAIIMGLIISLFFLFLGIAAVAVVHFFIPGGAFHRHRHRLRRRSTTNTQLPADSSGAAYSAVDIQRSLPRLKYDARLPGALGRDCAVCLDCFKEGDWCRNLPECQHLFHAICVDNWLIKVANCPICRTPVRLSSTATGRESGEDDCKLLWAAGI